MPPTRGSLPGVSSGASSSTGGPLEVPTPIATASGKKLALASPAARLGVEVGQAEQASALSEEASDSFFEGLRMLLVEIVQGAVRRLAKCQHCNTILDVKESLGLRHKAGVVTRIVLFCPECGEEEFFSNPSQAKSINSKLVFASKLVGVGSNGADTFCRALGLPSTLSQTSFVKHTEDLAQLSTQAVEDSFNVASANLHRHSGVAEDEIVDSVFYCDGTWSKRGHTAGYGVVWRRWSLRRPDRWLTVPSWASTVLSVSSIRTWIRPAKSTGCGGRTMRTPATPTLLDPHQPWNRKGPRGCGTAQRKSGSCVTQWYVTNLVVVVL